MTNLKRLRRQFIIIASVLGVITAASLIYLVSPVGASNAEKIEQVKQASREVDIKENQARPLRGLPEKLVKTNEDILTFYRDRLPVRQSEISEEIGKLASANGVTLSDVKYEDFDTDIPELREVMVEAQLAGEYSRIARFINAAERDKLFLLVNGITLDDQKSGVVRLQLHFETYLRPISVAATEKSADENSPAPAKARRISPSVSEKVKAKR